MRFLSWRIRDARYVIQKWLRGYSDLDIWNLCNHLSKIISHRLKVFRKKGFVGFPSGLTMKKWEKIIDEMIWTFENWDRDEECFHHHGPMVFADPDAKGNRLVLDSGCTLNKKKLEAHNKRVEEGFLLFAKYFRHLWD